MQNKPTISDNSVNVESLTNDAILAFKGFNLLKSLGIVDAAEVNLDSTVVLDLRVLALNGFILTYNDDTKRVIFTKNIDMPFSADPILYLSNSIPFISIASYEFNHSMRDYKSP